ncbi:peptidase M20 family protein [Cavenderia fasciculata]|uniref:Peptidase M20 family protein n=1 Tax=Cavenderia fasciculata TaxID=261658 RepID=F4PTW9_CACFS|nr:peptidase M20 family protein [Cavenderia fasciculata]EGG20948.1 peptidase M20 family protein [Cavenderia fasciculata]|eukprot:XP_004358798.1 peptidase M20 family protein [Cavenderia fasciculata]
MQSRRKPSINSKKFSILGVLAKSLLLLVIILIYNTVTFTSKQPNVETLEKGHQDSYNSLSEDQLAKRLGQSIQFKTISHAEEYQNDYEEFIKLHAFLKKTFPLVHSYLDCQVIGDYSLLYHWKGQDPTLKPIMFAAHMDVVPIVNEDKWSYPPFSGKVADGYVWGRGSMDDKLVVMALLEAIEDQLASGHHATLQRSIYLAFGHDEEVGGYRGASKMAAYLEEKGVTFEYILDEGLPILLPPVFPGITRPIATLGMAEKGGLNLHLSVASMGGHSSMPPKHTAIGILSAAITKIEENPMPLSLQQARLVFDYVGREATLPMKLVFANMWLFEPIVSKVLSKTPALDALQRTTTAVTVFNGGNKPNVLPAFANATINFRIAPSDSIQRVIDHIRTTIDDDRITLSVSDSIEPAPVTSPHTPSFKLIQSTIIQEFSPDVIVAPAIMIANTDTRWYWNLTPNIYRFCPQLVSKTDHARFHGVDERISTSNYKQLVDFYYHLIKNGDKKLN